MAQMCEISFSRSYPADQIQSLTNCIMSEVVSVSQGIYNQDFQIRQFPNLILIDRFCICYVCEISDSVSEDRQFAVVDANRYYFQSLNEEWIQIYVVEPECRRPWIGILFEAVIKPFAQGFRHVWFEKYRQWFGGAERSEVVESANMVGVAVGYKQRIDIFNLSFKSLGTEVGGSVNQ